MSDPREKVEEAANRIRKELMVTLSELDRRRDQALDPRYQLQQHMNLVLGAAGAVAVGTGAVIGWGLYRRNTAAERLRRERKLAFRRAWQHPERVATRAKERPAPQELLRKLSMIFALAFGTQLAKRAALKLIPSPAPTPAA